MKNDKHDEIDLIQIAHQLWANKRTILIITLLFLMMGCSYLAFSKPKWVSEAMISLPEVGQLANYPEAINLNLPKREPLNEKEFSSIIFNRYLANVDAYIAKEKALSPVNITKSKESSYYVVSFSAMTAKTAQLKLTDLLEALNQQTRLALYRSASQALDNRKQAVQQQLDALEKTAKIKQQQHVVLLENALQIAKDTKVNINEIKQLPDIIPDEALFMMGVPALEGLIKQEQNWPLQLSDEYYDNQVWLTRLSSFRLDDRYFQAFTLVSPASLATHRTSPKATLVMVLSVILGVLVGGSYVLAREAFRAAPLCLSSISNNKEPKL